MANMDLLSYERDSRWMPHLSWTYPDWNSQEKMAQQAAQREQAWQKIADKLGPLLIGSEFLNHAAAGEGGGIASFGQSDFIVSDIDEPDEKAYEKAPLLSANIRAQQIKLNQNQHNKATRNNYQSLNQQHKLSQTSPRLYSDSIDSLRPSQSPMFSEKESQSSGVESNYLERQKKTTYQQHNEYLYQVQQQRQHVQQQQQHYHDLESYQKAKRRCWTVSGILVLLVLLLFTLILLMAFGVIRYQTFPRVPI